MRLLLSCISTKHSVLKQHWTNTSQETPAACPLTVLGSYEKPKEDLGGLLCLIEDMGCSQQTIGLHMAAGMVASMKMWAVHRSSTRCTLSPVLDKGIL